MPDFNSDLGLVAGDDNQSIELEAGASHQIAPGTIHFAVLTTMAEVSAAQAVARPVVPAQISVSLLRRAAPGRLVARGRVIKQGRRLAIAAGDVFQNETLVATATITFAIMD